MKRVESDLDEQREIDEALSRQATPSHEQITEEFDSRELLQRLGQLSLKLRGPPEDGWEQIES